MRGLWTGGYPALTGRTMSPTVTEATSSRGRSASKIRLFWQTVSPSPGVMPPPALVRSWVVPSV